MRKTLLISLVTVLIYACNNSGHKKETGPVTNTVTDSLRQKAVTDSLNAIRDSILIQETSQALGFLKSSHYDSLAAMVHPSEGLRFSPYSYVDTSHDQVISSATISSWKDKKKRVRILWGTTDPADEPISLNIDSYIKRYVYDADFLHADSVKVNKVIGTGNTINNIEEVYPGCDFVECHFPGFDKKMGGMDWRSVRLIFKQISGKYYLVGIVHDEWSS